MAVITASLVAIYVADKILEHFIQEETGYKKIWHWLFPPKKFKSRLLEIIDATIREYELSHPLQLKDDKFPFYQSQVFFNQLNQFILFKKNSFQGIESELSQFPKIIKPTQRELDDFYDLFVFKLENDPILKALFIDENYKSQIYEVSQKIEGLEKIVIAIKDDTKAAREILEAQKEREEKLKLNQEKVLESLGNQISRQLKKQINSGKYLPNTFIETGRQKDFLRYLCDPIFYSKKCSKEIDVMDFRYLNTVLSKHQLSFKFDFTSVKGDLAAFSFANINDQITRWLSYLTNKKQEITDIRVASNEKSKFEYKFSDRITDLEFLNSRVALITEMAGQGKTNLMCDFVDNFLCKRNIPSLFVTGAEISANDIRQTLLQRIFPDQSSITWQEVMSILKETATKEGKFFVIIIDGINENSNSKVLSHNLETFISEILDHKFVRIVLTCRTEYYESNFSNLEKSSFAHEMKRIQSLTRHRPDDKIAEKLFDVYFDHFKIEYRGISSKAKSQLVTNFLLLRIFCETYRNSKLDFIENIYKEDLFENYFIAKTKEINERLRRDHRFESSASFNTQNFITKLLSEMIRTEKFVNIPLSDLLTQSDEKELYIQFLDENILVRRDIGTDNQVFTETEVVNFTFDEFRDFLISRYLIQKVFTKDKDGFRDFISKHLVPKSPLLEGCSTFLFFVAKRSGNAELQNIIEDQAWFNGVFSRCIFNVNDSQITQEDKKLILSNLRYPEYRDSIVWNLIVRFDQNIYKNLNIDFLFEFLRTLSSEDSDEKFSDVFTTSDFRELNQINQNSLIGRIEEIFDEGIEDDSPYHKIFELLLYMFNNEDSWRIQTIYEKYGFKFPKKRNEQLGKALNCKNERLKEELLLFIEEYEIQL